jgi:hypothetical protein
MMSADVRFGPVIDAFAEAVFDAFTSEDGQEASHGTPVLFSQERILRSGFDPTSRWRYFGPAAAGATFRATNSSTVPNRERRRCSTAKPKSEAPGFEATS